MLLAVDIGNSSIKFGVFDGETLHSKFSIPTKRDISADELRPRIEKNLDLPVTEVIVCSVVPEIKAPLYTYLRSVYGIEPFFVTNDTDLGLAIKYEPLDAAGTDRIVNAFAAAEKYRVPCIICSFGTATTIDVVSKERQLLGGLIAPGMAAMSKSLQLNTAQLPEVDIIAPDAVINHTTETSIRSGIFYAQIGLVETAVLRVKNEIGDDPKVIAAGGFASMLAAKTDVIDLVDENLLLDGLRLIHRRRS